MPFASPFFLYTLEVLQKKSRCGEIELWDITGVYDPDSNPGGYGDNITNPDVNEITTASCVITFSDGSVYSNADISTTTPPFPNSGGTPRVLAEADFGFRPPDGKMTIVSVVTGEDSTGIEGLFGKFTGTFFLTCNVKCCIANMHHTASGTSSCESKEWKAYDEAALMYAGLLHLIECKSWTEADVVLAQLQHICASNGNSNCHC